MDRRLELRRPRWRNSTFLMSSRSALGRAGRLSGWTEQASNTPWPSSSTRRPARTLRGQPARRGRSPRGTWPTGTCGGLRTTGAWRCWPAGCPARRSPWPGKQLGANDERDLFAWAVRAVREIQPRGAAAGERQGAEHQPVQRATGSTCWTGCARLGTSPGWRAAARVRFRRPAAAAAVRAGRSARAGRAVVPLAVAVTRPPATVGETLGDLMAARGWPGAAAWARRADRIAPTIVGGSKKHGGADLGPTRAKRAWAELGVDGIGVADCAPGAWMLTRPLSAAADLRDGGQAAGLAGRLGLAVQRPQDRALPADRQRVPAAGGGGAGFGHPPRAGARGRARRRAGGRRMRTCTIRCSACCDPGPTS